MVDIAARGRAYELANVFDLLVALAPSPREADARFAVDGEVVHLLDRELGCLAPDELDEAASLAGRDLAVGDLAKVVEETLLFGKDTKNARERRGG